MTMKPIQINKPARLKEEFKKFPAGTIVHVIQEYPLGLPNDPNVQLEIRLPNLDTEFIQKSKVEYSHAG